MQSTEKLCLYKPEKRKSKEKDPKRNKKQNEKPQTKNDSSQTEEWKPLLLIIPLRLGLNEINPIYINGLKVQFSL